MLCFVSFYNSALKSIWPSSLIEPCPRAMFGSNCNITQSRLPSDVECRGEVVSCDDWPFRRGEGQGVFGPSFHKGFLCLTD